MVYLTDSKLKYILFYLFDIMLSWLPKKKKEFPLQIKNILIIKPDHLGDMLLMTVILPMIKRKYSEANIDVVCGDWAAEILLNNPYIRSTIMINTYALNRKKVSFFRKFYEFLVTLFSALKTLNQNNYDLCLYMRSSKGNLIPLHWLLKQTYSVGYGVRARGVLLDKTVQWKNGPHEIDTFLGICTAINVVCTDKSQLKYELYPSAGDEKYVQKVMQEYSLIKYSFIVIHLGSGDQNRLLKSAFWKYIIQDLDQNIKIIFTGLKSEYYLYEELQLRRDNTLPLFGKLTIHQLYLFMKMAKQIFTVESLSAHLAGMTEVPSVSYYRYNPDWWKPYNAENVVIEMIKSEEFRQ